MVFRSLYGCRVIEVLRIFLCGVCIGIADLIPGISGGTVALILGLYHRILSTLQTFNTTLLLRLWRGEWRALSTDIPWRFLLPLAMGIVLALICCVHAINWLLSQPYYRQLLEAAFNGLVVASAYLMAKRIKQWTLCRTLLVLIAATVAFVCSTRENKTLHGAYSVAMPVEALPDTRHKIANYDMTQNRLTGLSADGVLRLYAKGVIGADASVEVDGSLISVAQLTHLRSHQQKTGFDVWIFSCGIIGICAALLPGISGSYCLHVLGVYTPVLAALADVATGLRHASIAWESGSLLVNLMLGVLVGGIVFARFVSWALHRHHDITMALMVGFMLGALRSLWPFYTSVYVLDPAYWDRGPQLIVQQQQLPIFTDSLFWWVMATGTLAFSAVILLERMSLQSSMGTVFSKTSRVQ
jgi:putative membrane protein